MHGFGLYSFPDGKSYRGYFIDDKKDGFGHYTWNDGKEYLGWWSNGKQEGYGMFTAPGQPAKFGVWQDGKRQAWLSDEELSNIKQKHLNANHLNLVFEKEMTSDCRIPVEEVQRMTYEKPSNFDEKANDVLAEIAKIENRN